MKLPWEKKHICWGVVAFLVIAASLVFFMIMNHWETVSGFFGLITKSMRPITYGLLFAYLLNPLMKVIEKSSWSKAHHYILWHGRLVCKARKPMCENCTISEFCKYYKKVKK